MNVWPVSFMNQSEPLSLYFNRIVYSFQVHIPQLHTKSGTMSRLKILCLHGFTSNGQVHAHQLRRIVKALPDYDFDFPDGPHEVDITTAVDLNKGENQTWAKLVSELSTSGHRAWWFARDENWQNKEGGFFGLEDSLTFLGKYMHDRGPFHAIWGFSQGACLAGMLAALLQEKQSGHPLRQLMPADLSTPKASVIFSGFRARFPQYDSVYEPGIDVPMLHVIGQDDQLVNSERSEALRRVCSEGQFLKHGGGHNIPKGEVDQKVIVDFTRSCGEATNVQP